MRRGGCQFSYVFDTIESGIDRVSVIKPPFDQKGINKIMIEYSGNEKENNVSDIVNRCPIYIGEYSKDRELQNEYFYLSKEEFLTYETQNEVIQDTQISWNNVYKFNLLKDENHYNIKPLYIKKIEGEK